jgi:hypothetical protein
LKINYFILLILFFICNICTAGEAVKMESMISAIQELKKEIAIMGDYDAYSNSGSILNFETSNIREKMKYFENNEPQFIVLAQLTKEGKVDYEPHTKLFFLTNDALILKDLVNLKDKKPEIVSLIDEYYFRLILNAKYLENYLTSLEQHVENGMIKKLLNKDSSYNSIAEKFYNQSNKSFVSSLRDLSEKKDSYKNKLANMSKNQQIGSIPFTPMGIGMILNDETANLNIYMSKEMGEQLKAWLARQQADGMRTQAQN